MSHPLPDPAAAPAPLRVKFACAVLVCGDCEQRGNGPKKLRAREARKTLKQALAGAQVKARIVQSSCLGLCPKKAMALVAIHPTAPVQAVEARSEGEVGAFGDRVRLALQ